MSWRARYAEPSYFKQTVFHMFLLCFHIRALPETHRSLSCVEQLFLGISLLTHSALCREGVPGAVRAGDPRLPPCSCAVLGLHRHLHHVRAQPCRKQNSHFVFPACSALLSRLKGNITGLDRDAFFSPELDPDLVAASPRRRSDLTMTRCSAGRSSAATSRAYSTPSSQR